MKPSRHSALIGFLVLTASPSSRGAIVYWDNQEIAIPSTFTGIYVDLTTGDTHTSDAIGFSTAQVNFFFGGLGVGSDEDFLPARVGTGSLDPIQATAPGTQVGPTLLFGPIAYGGSDSHVSVSPTPNQFESGVPGFLGFQLDLNEDEQFVFGWMRVTLTNGSSEGTIHEWAYSDTPGEPIAVGAVPEMSSFLLVCPAMMLALGARRRV